MNFVIKLLILIIILLLLLVGLFFAKAVNLDFEGLKNDEPIQNTRKAHEEDISEDKAKKINDSINQREDRIKALKEVGKKLGG